jgi:hypothetical protein
VEFIPQHCSLAALSLYVRSGKLLLVFDSTVILGSQSRGIIDHIFLSHKSGSRAAIFSELQTIIYSSSCLIQVERD